MVVSRLCSHARMFFVPLWIHDDGLMRLVIDVEEELKILRSAMRAKGDALSRVREWLRQSFSLVRASGDVEF